MKLILPKILDKFSHDEIVKTLMELNPRFYRPNRGSWRQGIPDLEDASREVVEVALTKLRDAWGQCLYYYRSGATCVHLVLSPRHYLDYTTKESAFIKANPIPNVEVHALPELLIKSYPLPKNWKKCERKIVHVPKLGFIVTEEEKEKALKKNKPKERPREETKKKLLTNIETTHPIEDDALEKFDVDKVTDAMSQFDLVPILSPCGHLSYITRKSYEESKEPHDSGKVNFWRPLK